MDKRNVILVADDELMNRKILKKMFEEQYEVVDVADGQDVIDYLKDNSEKVACLLLDLLMPGKNGFDVMDYMTEQDTMDAIPTIMITGDDSKETEENAYNYGVSDIIYKPFVPRVVMRRVKNVVDLYMHVNHMEDLVAEQTRSIEEQAENLKKNNELLIDALSGVVEFRMGGAANHNARIKKFTELMLKYVADVRPELALSAQQQRRIVRASALHDIGKIALSDEVLMKDNSPSRKEEELLHEHTTKGCEILDLFSEISDQEFYQDCYDICRYHHERWDGKGYPDGLAGDKIPLSAQIVALADAYDTLISGHGYTAAFTHTAAVNELFASGEGQFSPLAVECFKLANEEIRRLVEFPYGVNLL